jgi:hypothetical protein
VQFSENITDIQQAELNKDVSATVNKTLDEVEKSLNKNSESKTNQNQSQINALTQSQIDALTHSQVDTLDPFDLNSKFSDNYSMFKSAVEGMSSTADNEAFLTSALKNISTTAMFSEGMDGQAISANKNQEPVKETITTSQSPPVVTEKRKRKKEKQKGDENKPVPRKKVKITVFEESVDTIDDVPDLARSHLSKHIKKEEPRAGTSGQRRNLRARKGPDSMTESSDTGDAASDVDPDSGPVVIVAAKSKSIDHCPRCHSGLNALSGGYTLNLATYDIRVTCIVCRQNIIIKNAFTDLKAFEP